MEKFLAERISNPKIYNYTDIKQIIIDIGIQSFKKNNKNIEYLNLPLAFDIETTSFYKKVQSTEQKEKRAIMYEWSFSFYGYVIIGRTWEEFLYVIDFISDWFRTNNERRIVVYVHNLAYEFQFMRKWFKWSEVFALEKRKPVKAVTENGIEFRCSYLLSGYSLAKLGENLHTYKVKKMEGDLDYKLLRNSKTKLTEKELNYCINDVLVVTAYIQELIEEYEYIYLLPNTKTGFVRDYCRRYCLYGGTEKRDNNKYLKYTKLMKGMKLTLETYVLLKRTFMGGFTHANAIYSNMLLNNITSFDFTSSYPYVMLSEKFPMETFKLTRVQSTELFERYIKNYACIIEIKFTKIELKEYYETYLSKSHCYHIKNAEYDNGRIVMADELTTTITEQDYLIIKDLYKYEKFEILSFYTAIKRYLPTDFVLAILDLYETKTILKDVEGKEVEYMHSKENINSAFGMTVTDICRDEIIYTNDWYKEETDMEELINKHNKSTKRFLYYAWGVWITAYARRNLFSGICEFKYDYVYSDTDSIKVLNVENHREYIEKYNNTVIEKLKTAMVYHKIDFNRTCPKNKYGEVKQIGIWEEECTYTRFKTLGAKRYMFEKYNKKGELEINLTVSGLNKKKAIPYLLKKYGSDGIFDAFNDELHIEPEFTGKLTHTYIDEEIDGFLTDYQGNSEYYHELSYIHLDSSSYDLTIAELYKQYLFKIKENISYVRN